MTMEEVCDIVKLLNQLSPKACKVLADIFNYEPGAANLKGWRLLLTMICQWELQQKYSDICSSKEQLVQCLQAAADKVLDDHEHGKLDREIIETAVKTM